MTPSGAGDTFEAPLEGGTDASENSAEARCDRGGGPFTFVGRVAPFEADDTHKFNVQWRSASGAPVNLHRGVLNLLFERGTQGC